MRQHKIPFQLRGHKLSRIDAFSDVVFGFVLTLLVVSLEVPHTFAELMTSLHGFIPFSICFFFLMQIWYVHYTFFRRYGLEDFKVIILNSALLFVVLLFVYPLKFLFTLVTGYGAENAIHGAEGRTLMTIYGLGFMAVWTIFGLMYVHALRLRKELNLNELEIIETHDSIFGCFAQVGVALLATVIAQCVSADKAGYTGFLYMLIGVTHTYGGAHYGKKRRLAEERILTPSTSAVTL